jgi:hypothetical protein
MTEPPKKPRIDFTVFEKKRILVERIESTFQPYPQVNIVNFIKHLYDLMDLLNEIIDDVEDYKIKLGDD